MANPSNPRAGNDTTGIPLPYGIYDEAGADTAGLVRLVNEGGIIDDETTESHPIATSKIGTWGSAVINASSSGDNTLVAAAGAGKVIAVYGYALIVAGAVTVRFESGAGGTALTGQMAFAAAGDGISVPAGSMPLFKTAANTLLNLELGGAVSVQGWVVYRVEG